MHLNKDNIYAFDECSIINQYEINIPPAFRGWFGGKQKIVSENYPQLKQLSDALKSGEIPKYKFTPSNFEYTAKTRLEREIKQLGVNLLFLENLRANFIMQLKDFLADIEDEYLNIEKNNEIREIKEFFKANEKDLKKEQNLPDDDDCKILAGYLSKASVGKKHLVSFDEHFWGYGVLIWTRYKIAVVPEWRCDKLCGT